MDRSTCPSSGERPPLVRRGANSMPDGGSPCSCSPGRAGGSGPQRSWGGRIRRAGLESRQCLTGLRDPRRCRRQLPPSPVSQGLARVLILQSFGSDLRALQRGCLAISQRALPPLAPADRVSRTLARHGAFLGRCAGGTFRRLSADPLRRPQARPRGGGGQPGDALHPRPAHGALPVRAGPPLRYRSAAGLAGASRPPGRRHAGGQRRPGTGGAHPRPLPDLENLAIVLGRSPIEQYWRAELARDLDRFSGRLHLLWLDDLPLDSMRRQVASLPPHSALLYILLLVDAAGVPHQLDNALSTLAAESNTPTFGLFESQLGCQASWGADWCRPRGTWIRPSTRLHAC